MSWRVPLVTWIESAANSTVTLSGDRSSDGLENMLVFPVADAQASSVTVAEMDDFLMEVFRLFCRKLVGQRGRAWFYAWHDEMSGTLRCSVVAADAAGDLPFSCRLDVVDVPSRVSQSALTSGYAGGIPINELTPGDWNDEDELDFALTVFARPVIAEVR